MSFSFSSFHHFHLACVVLCPTFLPWIVSAFILFPFPPSHIIAQFISIFAWTEKTFCDKKASMEKLCRVFIGVTTVWADTVGWKGSAGGRTRLRFSRGKVYQLCKGNFARRRQLHFAYPHNHLAGAVQKLPIRTRARQFAVENWLQGHSDARKWFERRAKANKGDAPTDKNESSFIKF